ncbi:rRNA pseudouridine synthase, partial [candidate division KSB1 bacterium]|nr:rRNA pseudouridine synthase [candidate division KSB1 bacterium]NIR72821.1 rRNA pseudouridine synthase [candidate division KSB1 bacterium]NIS26861.1 rRNA pseudouridine synthase [candidate division KSB1 bacterium]NIT73657.1 rRNA pseudouridine synthase [candidate division KSB1 bacterium]NIU27528.1 rRNA pseudouridine synthase [candidate division KSB1 bacterium]
ALEYILLNKPKGVVTTVSDEKSRKTVVDLISSDTRLFPVGRLDIDTTGLLLLTNDGELTYRLMHPKFNVDKTYEVYLDSELNKDDEINIENGIYLEEGKTAKCRIVFPESKNRRRVHLTIHQGWKRQIRRMFAHLGYHVLELKRIAMASLRLNGLAVGQWRKLSSEELNKLRTEIGRNHGNY